MRLPPIALLFLILPLSADAQALSTPKGPVVDTLYGTPVPDPYRWLEDTGSDDVLAWFRSQGAHARRTLDALPGRPAILARIREIGAASSPDVSLPREAGGRWFYMLRRPEESVARGYVRDPGGGEGRLLVDPGAVETGGLGANTIASFLPSPDGLLVLVGVTVGGSEAAVLRVLDAVTGEEIEGPFERNRWDFNAWSPDGRAFFYIRFPDRAADAPPTEAYRGIEVVRHRLGDDPAADTPVFSGPMLGEDAGLLPFVTIDARSGLAFGILTPGTPHGAWYVARAGELAAGVAEWRPIFSLADSVADVAVDGEHLYVLTRAGRPRIVRTPLQAPDLSTAEEVLAEGRQSILSMGAARDGLYIGVFAEGTNGITRIPWGGEPEPVALPDGTSVSDIRTDPLRSGARMVLDSWTATSTMHGFDPSTHRITALPLRPLGPFDRFDDLDVEAAFATSHDGVRVPVTILWPRAAPRDGSVPMLLLGYGAYGSIDAPEFHAERRVWYESGGAAAVCHVRGGGYYGETWHRAGQKATKPNSWLDFIACAEHLVRQSYTSPERLVALGGSAGGITVGRAITERPDLFAAVNIQNGVLDAVRAEKTPAGPPNVTEFGSVATEEGFRALLDMSTLHHVRHGARYPAVLLFTGLSDARVAPWQSGKLAAALQAATGSGRPVLLRVEESAGHVSTGFSAEQRRQMLADLFSFFMAEVGLSPATGSRGPRGPRPGSRPGGS